jgi:type I restriction enzyme, S subunit
VKTAVIRSSWMEGYGYRLDTRPYLGGALETKLLLEQLPLRKDPLHTLTAGVEGGIYNGPHFSRTFVQSVEYGVPFVGGSSMLYADLSDLPLLSKKQAMSPKLAHLELKPGMSLISCSGTIGKMAYARRDMAGMWSSQHIMKVVADPAKIPSGYLYAYLSSKFGIPLVTSGTYGAIIQSINPEHIRDLPVPRLGDALEHEIHALVEEAAELRVKATERFRVAIRDLEVQSGLPSSEELLRLPKKQVVIVQSSKLEERLDTNFHRSYHYDALQPYKEGHITGVPVARLADSIVEPVRFKRVEHDDDDNGIPFFGTGSLGDIDPQPLYRIAPFRDIDQYRVDERSILVPRSGQIYGLIGRAMQPIGRVLQSAVTEDAIRVTCSTPEDAGFIFLALRSECGLRQLKARCFGGSIPHLDVVHVGRVLVPDLNLNVRRRLGEMACRVSELRSDAINKECRARDVMEAAIETRAGN